MIVRKDEVRAPWRTDEPSRSGPFRSQRLSEIGGLTQFGAYIETLQPGSRSSDRHWHEQEDEMLYLLSGECTIIEDDGEHRLLPGDAACWPAGAPNAHTVVNHSNAPCTYLICGTRVSRDVVHYPDLGQTLHINGKEWRILGQDGAILKEGVE